MRCFLGADWERAEELPHGLKGELQDRIQDSGGSQMHIAEKYSLVWCVHGITVTEIENKSFGFDAACPGGGNSLTAKLLSRLFS